MVPFDFRREEAYKEIPAVLAEGVRKMKLILSTVLAGLAYALILFTGVWICQGGTVAVSSFGFGATIGVLLHLLDIPRAACKSKALSLGSFLTLTLFAASAFLGLTALKFAWPSVTFGEHLDFIWALIGCLAATLVLSGARLCCRKLNTLPPPG